MSGEKQLTPHHAFAHTPRLSLAHDIAALPQRRARLRDLTGRQRHAAGDLARYEAAAFDHDDGWVQITPVGLVLLELHLPAVTHRAVSTINRRALLAEIADQPGLTGPEMTSLAPSSREMALTAMVRTGLAVTWPSGPRRHAYAPTLLGRTVLAALADWRPGYREGVRARVVEDAHLVGAL